MARRALHRVPEDARERLRDVDDSELVVGFANSLDGALEELIARYGDRLCTYLYRIVRDGGWADDLVQEVFVRIVDRAHTYDQRWPVQVWIFRIARNLAIDLLRREGSMQSRLQEFAQPATPPTPVQAAEEHEFQVALEQAIADLPESFRSVFLLRESEGLSYDEIAEVLEIPAKTVSSRLHRSRTLLKDQLRTHLTP